MDKILETAKIDKADADELRAAPIRHVKLNEHLIARIRLIRSSLLLCYPHSMAFWMDGFQRDMNVETEIRHWEHISTCFLEIIVDPEMFKQYKGSREEFYSDVFDLLFCIREIKTSKKFSAKFIKKAKDIYSYTLPIYDFDDELPFKNRK
jgi:hypothetical protein